jgi:hypothetical protein
VRSLFYVTRAKVAFAEKYGKFYFSFTQISVYRGPIRIRIKFAAQLLAYPSPTPI